MNFKETVKYCLGNIGAHVAGDALKIIGAMLPFMIPAIASAAPSLLKVRDPEGLENNNLFDPNIQNDQYLEGLRIQQVISIPKNSDGGRPDPHLLVEGNSRGDIPIGITSTTSTTIATTVKTPALYEMICSDINPILSYLAEHGVNIPALSVQPIAKLFAAIGNDPIRAFDSTVISVPVITMHAICNQAMYISKDPNYLNKMICNALFALRELIQGFISHADMLFEVHFKDGEQNSLTVVHERYFNTITESYVQCSGLDAQKI